MKTALLFDNKDAALFAADARRNEYAAVAASPEAGGALDAAGIAFRPAAEILTTDDFTAARKAAIRLSREWYRPIRGVFTDRELCFATAVEIDVWLMLQELLTAHALCEKLIAEERIESAWIGGGAVGRLAAALFGCRVDGPAAARPAPRPPATARQIARTALARFRRADADPPPPTGARKIAVFAAAQNRSSIWQTIHPPLAELPADRTVFISTQPNDFYREHLKSLGVPFTLLDSCGAVADAVDALRRAAELMSAIRPALASLDPTLLPDFRPEAVKNAVAPALTEYFSSRLFYLLHTRNIAARLVRAKQVAAFLTATDMHPFERTLLITAESLGVKCMSVQHGVPDEYFAPIHTTKIAVWGNEHRRWFEARGVPREAILVAGQPRFDRLARFDAAAARAGTRTAFGIGDGERVALFGTLPMPAAECEKTAGFIFDALRGMDVFTIVKVHPSESEDFYRRLAERAGLSRFVVTRDHDVHAAIAACDALITTWSTVVVEATLLNRCSVTVNLSDGESVVPFAKQGFSHEVRDAENLKAALNDFFTGGPLSQKFAADRERVIEEHLFKADGNAAKRIAAAVEALAAGRHSCPG